MLLHDPEAELERVRLAAAAMIAPMEAAAAAAFALHQTIKGNVELLRRLSAGALLAEDGARIGAQVERITEHATTMFARLREAGGAQ